MLSNVTVPIISGTPMVGQTLSVSNGTWNNDTTGNNHTVVSADLNSTITCLVTASNNLGSVSALSNSTTAVTTSGNPPVNTATPVLSGSPLIGNTLSCTNGQWSNNPISFTYQWLSNGGVITGANAASYMVTTANAGAILSCNVTASNVNGSATAGSNTSAHVTTPTVAPINSTPPVISGNTAIGNTLSCSVGTWSNNPTSYTYTWKYANTGDTIGTQPTYLTTNNDANKNVFCIVTATGSGGISNPVNSNVLTLGAGNGIINNTGGGAGTAININPPVISGTLTEPSTLTCTTTASDWVNSPTGFNYQWVRNGSNVAGATSQTYITGSSDVGTNITCLVIAINGSGTSNAVVSNSLGPIAAAPNSGPLPQQTVRGTITGNIAVGSTIILSSPGTWTNNPTGYAIFLKANGVDLASAVSDTTAPGVYNSNPTWPAGGNTYQITANDLGKTLSYYLDGVNSNGGTASPEVSLGPVQFGMVVAPSISSPLTVGSTITCSPGTWNPMTNHVQYTFTNVNAGTFTQDGNTPATYTLLESDIGKYIGCDLVIGLTTNGNLIGGTHYSVQMIGPVVAAPLNPILITPPTFAASNTIHVGSIISVFVGQYAPTPPADYFTFDWTAGGRTFQTNSGIGGNNQGSNNGGVYTLQASDVGYPVSCIVTAYNTAYVGGSGTAATLTSLGALVVP